MRTLFLTFSLAVAAILSLPAQGNIPQPTHFVVKIAETPALPLENSEEGFVYYDNNGHTYQTKSNRWEAGSWVLNYREYYTLNAQGLPTQLLWKNWDAANSVLVNRFRTTIGYHPNGQENYRKVESWDSNTGQWETGQITTTTFTSNDKISERTDEYYIDGAVAFGYHYQHTYDASNRELQEIFQVFNNGNWMNYLKTDYLYTDADDDFDEALLSVWDDTFSVWFPATSRQVQTVTNTQRVVLEEDWDGTAWLPNSREAIYYDTNNQGTLYTFEEWDGSTSTWTLDSKYEYTYNNDLSISQFKYYYTDFDTDVLFLYTVVDYDYENYLVSEHTPAFQANVSVSPNPTADYIQVQLDGAAVSNLVLLDLHGKVVAQTSTSSKFATLSLVGQPAGAYFLRVEQGGFTKMLPVVKR